MTIRLIWPPRELSPNARVHWAKKAKITEEYRKYGEEAAKASGVVIEGDGKIYMEIIFLPPDKRRRDLDNMLSSCKSLLDGVADGLGVDDYRFRPQLEIGDQIKGGGVMIVFRKENRNE